MKLENVEFYPNIGFHELIKLIGESKIYIHTMRYEGFGLTTCETIAGGCIPCVIDSGGQRESVPFQNLRFRSVREAVEIIKRIDNMPQKELVDLKGKLFAHVKQFDESEFKKKMLKVIFNAS